MKTSQIYDHFKSIIEQVSQTKKSDMICTRLILSAAIGAVITNRFQRGSERTICPGKWPNRTVRGGVYPALLTIPAQAPPGQSDISNLLIKFNSGCDSNMRSGSHKSSHYSSNRKHPLSEKRKWVRLIHHRNRRQKSNRSIRRNQEILPVSY